MDGDTVVFTEATMVAITDTTTLGDGTVMDMDGITGAGADTVIHMVGVDFIAHITTLLIITTLIATILITIHEIDMAIITTAEVMLIMPAEEAYTTPIPI